jgi:uncharacterized phosphosugar-binding protein
MNKKGLEWYKVEMMKDTREYTNAELIKMLEEEFKIPVFINSWIDDEKNQEVYELYKQLRNSK